MYPQALFLYHCRHFGVCIDDAVRFHFHTTIFKMVSLAFLSPLHMTKLYFVHKVTKTCCWMLKADMHHIVIATYSCNSLSSQFISSAALWWCSPLQATWRCQDQPTLCSCALSWDNLVLSYPGYSTVS